MAEMLELLTSQARQRREVEHPQLIEGILYVTSAQYAEISRDALVDSAPTAAQMFSSIPIRVIEPGEQVELPSGKVLMYSKILESFCVMEKSVLNPVLSFHPTVEQPMPAAGPAGNEPESAAHRAAGIQESLAAADMFEPCGGRSVRVRCKVCGTVGHDVLLSLWPRCWKAQHLRGHAPCPKCGKQVPLLLNGNPQVHTRCPA